MSRGDRMAAQCMACSLPWQLSPYLASSKRPRLCELLSLVISPCNNPFSSQVSIYTASISCFPPTSSHFMYQTLLGFWAHLLSGLRFAHLIKNILIECLLYTRHWNIMMNNIDIMSALSGLTLPCSKQIIVLKKYYRLCLSDRKEGNEKDVR